MEIDRQEAIDNLRVAIKATLLVVPQHEYRIWAQQYLTASEPTTDMDELRDWAEDSIARLAGWQPWSGPGRARACWFAVKEIGLALSHYTLGHYQNVTMHALEAATMCMVIGEASQKLVKGFVGNLEDSLYGEVLTK